MAARYYAIVIAVGLAAPAPAAAQDDTAPAVPSFAPVVETTKRAIVDGDDELVGNRSEHLEQRGEATGRAA
jgi:hypothetical protein